MNTRITLAALGVLLFAGSDIARAQAAPPPNPASRGEPQLMFEREIFSYAGAGRRDPFRALTRRDQVGPIFDELTLSMIIFDEVPGQSVVVLADRSNRRYRLRRGESLGNATVISIGATRVVFSVNELGVRRQEVLEMKRTKPEGA
jgi:hypothetical protein